jgi:hypothetical protein
MRLSPRPALGLLAVGAVMGAIMLPLPAMAGISGPTLTIAKDCSGLSGTATLHLDVFRPGIEGLDQVGSFDETVDCGKSLTIFGIPQLEGTTGFTAGESITITESTGPSVSILPAASVSVTLGTAEKSVTVVDPPAVSIKKTCAEGVTGTATFSVSNATAEASVSVDVGCDTTVPVALPTGSQAGDDVVIHESTPPTNGVAAADVTVKIPTSTPDVTTIVNNAAVTATATPAPTPTPAVPVLAATGQARTPNSAAPVVIATMAGGMAVLLLGFGLWRRRRA